jgi:hypothetical protein
MIPCNCDGAKTKLKPIIIQRIERAASPVNACIITEIEFLLLISPDSKKPKAGIISMTKPVEISIHEVSPELIDIYLIRKNHIIKNVSSLSIVSAAVLDFAVPHLSSNVPFPMHIFKWVFHLTHRSII